MYFVQVEEFHLAENRIETRLCLGSFYFNKESFRGTRGPFIAPIRRAAPIQLDFHRVMIHEEIGTSRSRAGILNPPR